jgi:hypothetical protein
MWWWVKAKPWADHWVLGCQSYHIKAADSALRRMRPEALPVPIGHIFNTIPGLQPLKAAETDWL